MDKSKQLRIFAEEIRVETIKELGHLGFGHVGGCMSIVETLAVLYSEHMRIDPKNPGLETRDRLVLSKGHAGPVLYAVLALKGYFPMEELKTLNLGGTILPSHCDRLKTPGVDMTTGSLGQGMSSACGIALGNRIQKRDSYTYLIMGDGECNEGQVWEGAMFAAQYKLSNLIGFVDLNKQQLDGGCEDIMNMGDMVDKWTSFGWNTVKVDGHDIEAVNAAVNAAKGQNERPSMIILDTIKGKGCTAAERVFPCHHVAFKPEDIAESLADANAVLELARKA